MDVEAEIAELKRRMTVLENEVKADHEFSVKLFVYVREMRDDVALLRSHAVVADKRIERLEERVERIEASLDALRMDFKELRSDFAVLRSEFNTFRDQMPGMIADSMREVLREFRSR